MSIRGPLGATPNSAGVELGRASGLGTREALRNSRRGAIGLAGLLVCGALIAIAAANTTPLLPESIRPVPANLAGAFAGLGLNLHAGGTMAVLVLNLVCYLVVVSYSRQLSARAVLTAIAALYAVILLAPPLISTDMFSYQAYAREGALFGVNPYLNGPHGIFYDPLFQYIGAKWAYYPSVYGPVFTTLSYALAPLSIAAGLLAYKFVAVISALAIVAMVWNIARLRGVDPVKAVAIVGLNPLLALYGIGGGHNDLLMLVPLVGAVYASLLGRERMTGGLTMLAVGIKLTAGLVLPFALAAGGPLRDRTRRKKLLLASGISLAAIATLGLTVFGAGILNMFPTVEQSQASGDWHSVPGMIIALGASAVGRVIGFIFTAVFLVVTVRLLRKVWHGQMDWIDGAGWATFALLVSANSLLPWYVAWLLPLTALSSDRRLLRATLGLTCLVQLVQLPGYIPHAAAMIGY
jgi:alpha-1,6-mannosyltransferase